MPNELALAAITERAGANWYLTEQVLLQYHDRFMVQATEPGIAFIPWVGPPRAEILCVHDERGVAKDFTVRYQRLRLQIPQDPHRFHDVKVTVRVHEYPDGTLAVFHGPRCLARYHADGQLIETGRAHPRRNGPTYGSDVPRSSMPRPTVCETFRRAAERLEGRTAQIMCTLRLRAVDMLSPADRVWPCLR